MDIKILIEILEKSVEKNGEKPLTNKWLLNILKQAKKQKIKKEDKDNVYPYDPNWDQILINNYIT